MLYYVIMCYVIFFILHYITLHYITLHYITLHYITLHYITLHYITLHYITLYGFIHCRSTFNILCQEIACYITLQCILLFIYRQENFEVLFPQHSPLYYSLYFAMFCIIFFLDISPRRELDGVVCPCCQSVAITAAFISIASNQQWLRWGCHWDNPFLWCHYWQVPMPQSWYQWVFLS